MTIKLDGKMSSLLDFSKNRHEALLKIAKGEPLIFELDLGLIEGLTHPLGSEVETLSLRLSLDHFFKTLWEEFHPYAKEVSIYRGDLNFDEAIFPDYLKRLTAEVSASVPLSLNFKTKGENPLTIARKTSRRLFPRFKVWVDGKPPPFQSEEATIGFLLPNNKDDDFEALLQKGLKLRVIEETFLISEWQGLDYLLVDPDLIDNEAIRKLRGFNAAGGVVVSLGHEIGIPHEIPFDREMTFPHL